jgi:F-type H+-transporting ATPase subunit epsilon
MVEQSTEDKGAAGAPPGLATKFQLEIVTPEGQRAAVEVDELLAPGQDGQLGILPKHTRYMVVLGVGELGYRVDDEWHVLAVANGLMQVEGDRVIILAQTAELAHQIDVARAKLAKDRAEQRLADPDAEIDLNRAQASLERALVRLQVASRNV